MHRCCFAQGMRLHAHAKEMSPAPDESLISFISRASLESGKSWPSFQREVTGMTFASARSAERKNFAWDQIAARFSLPVSQIWALSERSLFPSDWSDQKIEALVHRDLPWLATLGYPSYNPAELTESPVFKRAWFQPSSLFDTKSGTLNLRHCCRCGTFLPSTRLPRALPICHCGTPYSAGPKVPAPTIVARLATDIITNFGSALTAPYSNPKAELRTLNAAWRVAAALDSLPALQDGATDLTRSAGFGDLHAGGAMTRWGAVETVNAAIRHAQLLGAALHCVRQYPDFESVVCSVVAQAGGLAQIAEMIVQVLSRSRDSSQTSLIV